MQADGKILVAGYSYISSRGSIDFALARYNTNGSLDTSFNGVGKVTTAIGAGTHYAFSVTIQDDSKILLVGTSVQSTTKNDFALVRFNSDGTLDGSFSGDGKVITDLGSTDWAWGVTVQPDGKILVAGGSNERLALARYNQDGSLDTYFSDDGIMIDGQYQEGHSVALQTDGKIIVDTGSGFNVARFNSDGTPDNSFANNGIARVPISSYSNADAQKLVVQPDDKILVVGSTSGYLGLSNTGFVLVRYNADGELDSSFNLKNTLDGIVIYTENNSAVVMDPDVAIYDAELQSIGNYLGASLILARHGGASPEDIFSADGAGNLSALTEGALFSFAGITIGRVTQNSGGTLVLEFNLNATQDKVNQTLQAIGYLNTSDMPPASVQIDWIFDDGNQGEQGSGNALSVLQSKTINIIAVNDAPILVNPVLDQIAHYYQPFSFTVPSDVFNDPDDSTLTYIATLADGFRLPSWLKFDASNQQFKGTPTATNTGTLEIMLTVRDAALATVSHTFNLVVQAPPLALNTIDPIIFVDTSNDDSFSLVNGTLIGNYGNNLVYGIKNQVPSGTAVSKSGIYGTLDVNTATGAYSFAPNDTAIESLKSNTSENFIVTVSDGTASGLTSFTVNLTGANDLPEFSSPTVISQPENIPASAVIHTVQAIDRDNDPINYQLRGPDAEHFSLDSQTGELRFIASPNYEHRSDYALVLVASDGSRLEDDFSSLDATRWMAANWANNGVFLNTWSPEQVSSKDGSLVLILQESDDGSYVSGEYRTHDVYGYGYYESRFTASDAKGVVTGFFTYTGPYEGTPHDEIDVEILGDDPTRMQVNYWTNGVSHSTSVDLGFDASQSMNTYAFDWQPNSITWYVNGEVVHVEDGSRGAITNTPGRVMFNLWATTNTQTWSSDAYAGEQTSISVDYFHYQSGKSQVLNVNVVDVNDLPTGSVSITGMPTQGQTLTATNTLADEDGLSTISYQWKANGASIIGATSNVFTLTQSEVGKAITVTASYTDGQDAAESVTSSATAAIANINDLPTGSVTITGTATQGQTLTASNTLADADGMSTVSYQWKADGSSISGATSNAFTLTQSEVGKTITVTASYLDGQGTAESVLSSATAIVENVNDAPTLITPTAANYTDTSANDTFTNTTGTLLGSDVDGDTLTYGIEGVTDSGITVTKTGTFGTLTVTKATGAYSFAPNDAAIEGLKSNAGENFTVNVSDGTATTNATFQINLTGANDPTVFGGSITGIVSKDRTLSASGSLTATDRDAGDAIITAQSNTTGSYGNFSIGTNGQWTYNLNNSATNVQALTAGQSVTDTFVVATAGGVSQNVVITITGADDTPTLSIQNGDAGNNILHGSDSDEQINGFGGNDTIYGLAGNDHLNGGGDNDDSLFGQEGNNTLNGDTGNDKLFGWTGNDKLFGWTGNDLLNGGAGDDELYGGPGNDSLDGGDGYDFAGFTGNRNQFTLSRDSLGVITVSETATGEIDTLINIEGIGFTDGYVPLVPGQVGNWHYGTQFGDMIIASTVGAGLFGDGGNDSLTGSSGSDYFHCTPGDGSDTLNGGGGNDFAGYQSASTGYSIAKVNANTFTVTAPNGDVDTLVDLEAIGFTDQYIGLIVQRFDNPDGSTWNQGTYLADTFTGTDASDGLRGGDGNDSLYGGNGRDYLEGQAGNDFLDGGADNDYAWFGGLRADYSLVKNSDGTVSVSHTASGETDTLINVEAIGFSDAPVVIISPQRWGNPNGSGWTDGSIFADSLVGTAHMDGMAGGDGNDTLDGGQGNDSLLGGAGADLFVFHPDSGFDRNADFNFAEGDRIQLDTGMGWFAMADSNPNDTWLSLGSGAGVALTGMDFTQVNNGWFLWA